MKAIWCDEHEIVTEDFERIASDIAIPWERFRGKTILITGATGFIGSLIAKALLYYSETRNMPLRLIAQIRSSEKAYNVFKGQQKFVGDILHFAEFDVRQPVHGISDVDFIIHTASSTVSADFVEKPVDTLMTSLRGTENILEFALRQKTSSVLFLSSMEVYGQTDHEDVKETDSGYLNPLSLRSSYPQGKRVSETLCAAYRAQFGVPVKIARLTLTFGAGVPATDNRVFAQFARAAITGRDIVLHTAGTTKRDYIYTSDAVRCLLSILLKGKDGEAYNVSNPDSYVSIRAMAELCCSFSSSSNLVFDINEEQAKKYAKEVRIKLDNSKMNGLNAFPKIGLKESFERMMQVMSL